MARTTETFSESWHRVAERRLALHAGVQVRRQIFRGERFYVLGDPLADQYFRLRPAAYEFVARLRRDRTVDEAWRECLERFPDEAPGQEAALRLLGQLYQANLLEYDGATDTAALFERYRKRTRRELKARLTNVMFFRIPLLDPDRLLCWALPLVRPLLGPFGAFLWLAVVALALKTVADNWSAVLDQYQGVLAPGNLPLLYAGLVVLKSLHEFGHAFMCRRYGGEVHTLGVLFMIFTPVPYVDVTSSWSFRSRWQRILVGSAGMIVEFFVAALAVFVWAHTGPGAVHSVAYNMMFVAGVSTLLFNLNPLLRFDGYFILSDLLGIPNLAQQANRQLRHLFEHHLFGVKPSEGPARNRREAFWFVGYGLASGVYRVVVFGGVLLAVADQYLLLGILMLFTCAMAWVLVPVTKFTRYLWAGPQLDRVRPRALAVVAGLTALLVLLLGIVPFPHRVMAPGVVRATGRAQVLTDAPGRVERLLAAPGSTVRAGEALVELRNPDLELALTATRAALDEIDARLRQTLSAQLADRQPLEARRQVLEDQVARLVQQVDALKVTSRLDGIWSAPEVRDYPGRWLPRGAPLGLVVAPGGFEFVATVHQADADRLFRSAPRNAGVRLRGQATQTMTMGTLTIVPGDNRTLPSPMLGWSGGGDIPIERTDPEGRRAAEPFFEVRAPLPAEPAAFLADGQSGLLRLALTPRPIVQQAWRRLLQLIQQRYQW